MNVLIAPRSSGQSTKGNYYCNSKQLPGESTWPESRPWGPKVSFLKGSSPVQTLFYLSFKKSLGELHIIPFSQEESSRRKFFFLVLGLALLGEAFQIINQMGCQN